MKALSLIQPWASLVALGAKKIETRSWGTNHRGLLAIHATKNKPRDWDDFVWEEPFRTILHDAGYTVWSSDTTHSCKDFPHSAIIAVAELVDCASTNYMHSRPPAISWRRGDYEWTVTQNEFEFGDYSPNRFAWLLKNVRALETPVACRGALGLWAVPPDVVAQIYSQLK